MMKQLLLYLLLYVSFDLYAQDTKKVPPLQQNQMVQPQLRRFVVADMETHVPVRGAIVRTKSGYRDTTNYLGICFVPTKFDTLSVSHPRYLTERLVTGEAKDSTFLLPNFRRLSEVTVWGKHNLSALDGIDDALKKEAPAHTSAPAGLGLVVTFDFAKMLDKRYRRDMKHLRKTREVFKQMDKGDEDPVVKAYKEAMEDKKRAVEKDSK
jgi:hypothetical protein